jgi:hypothetical protein
VGWPGQLVLFPGLDGSCDGAEVCPEPPGGLLCPPPEGSVGESVGVSLTVGVGVGSGLLESVGDGDGLTSSVPHAVDWPPRTSALSRANVARSAAQGRLGGVSCPDVTQTP